MPKGFNDSLITDLQTVSKCLDGYRFCCARQQLQDSSWQRVFFGTCFGPIGRDEPEVGPGVAGRLREFQRERAGPLSRSMLGGKRELVVMFSQIEKRV